MTALIDRDHRGHRDVVDQWTRLHLAAFPEPEPAASDGSAQLGAEDRGTDREITFKGQGRAKNVGRRAVVESKAKPFKTRLQSTGGTAQGQPSAARSASRPIINMEADRIQAILDDTPALFEISLDPKADPGPKDDESVWSGLFAVLRYRDIIEREAALQGVDAELVKAIVYMENAHDTTGQRLADLFRWSTSVLPMNIQPETWAGLSDEPIDFHDPEMNIRAGVTLIRRIVRRVDDPTPAKIASIWNFTGRELVSDFGARAQAVYENPKWRSPALSRAEYVRRFSDR